MRRIKSVLALLALMAAMVSVMAAPASADIIFCTGGLCFGSGENDTIFESPFNDRIEAGRGADDVFAELFGGEVDRVLAGRGRDFIDARDGDNRDTINCGPGRDVVEANRGDTVRENCERVR